MEEPKIEKVDDYTLQITTQPPTPEPIVQTYDRTFIENQIISIQKQKDDFDALRDAEIAQCQDILAQMDTQNIIARPEPVEVKPEPAPTDEPLQSQV
jgi:ABC-type transport system substrate-binding protein